MDRKLLIVDEQQGRGSALEAYFNHLVTVERYTDGITAIIKVLQLNPDIIVWSSTVPSLTGFELLGHIRASSRAIILIITPGTTEERLAYFEAGAEDVFPAHVEAKEIAFKVEAWLKRTGRLSFIGTQDKSTLTFGPLTINERMHKAFVNGEEITLTRKEFSILWMLLSKKEQIVSRLELLRIVWNYEQFGDDRMIDTHLNRIRKKLSKYSHLFHIRTIWGVGYTLELTGDNGKHTREESIL